MVSKLLELFVHDWSAATSNPWVVAAPIVVAPELAFITMPLAPICNLLVPVPVVIVKVGVWVVPFPMMMPAICREFEAVGAKL